MKEKIEKAVKKIFNVLGLEISRKWNSPVGEMGIFLQDLKKRGIQFHHVLDVGAYSGKFSSVASSVFPEAVFCLLEPLKEMNPCLEGFCKKHPQSKYFNIAAGPVNGSQSLRVFNDLTWSGFMDVNIPLKDERTPRMVEVWTIDSMIEKGQIGIPDLVKIDVQGYELEVLNGAKLLFGKTELFIIEASFHNKHKSFPLIADIIAYMNQRNYVVYDFAGFLRQPHDGSLVECDLCFVKKESFLRK